MKILLICGNWKKFVDVVNATTTTTEVIPLDISFCDCAPAQAGQLVAFNKTTARTDFNIPIFKAVA